MWLVIINDYEVNDFQELIGREKMRIKKEKGERCCPIDIVDQTMFYI